MEVLESFLEHFCTSSKSAFYIHLGDFSIFRHLVEIGVTLGRYSEPPIASVTLHEILFSHWLGARKRTGLLAFPVLQMCPVGALK